MQSPTKLGEEDSKDCNSDSPPYNHETDSSDNSPSNSKLGKRKPSFPESDGGPSNGSSSYELEDITKKPMLAMREMSGPSPVPVNEIPINTSDWNKNHLNILRIHPNFVKPLTPSDVISEGIVQFLRPCESLSFMKECKTNKSSIEITECLASAFKYAFQLDKNDISDVSVYDCDKLKVYFKEWRKDYQKQHLLAGDVEYLFFNIVVAADKFAEQLKYMVIMRKHKITLSEGMYQQLFMNFLEIFGLKVHGFSDIPSESLQIGQKIFTSLPDVLVFDQEGTDTLQNVIAVIEVKRDYGKQEEIKEIMETRSPKKKFKQEFIQNRQYRHISDSLIGQHGGELVSYLCRSVFEDRGLYGIIVQATKITFTSIVPEENYLEKLASGCLEEKAAEINISEEGNFLSREGRKMLFDPLLKLVLLLRFKYS